MKRVSALHKILARRPIRVLLVAALVVPGLVLATSSPALASQRIKETYSPWYVGAPSLSLYDPVVETSSGRDFNINPAGNGYEFQFTADTTKCVAAANNGVDVVIHPCNGNGTVWLEHQGRNTFIYESREFSGKYLSGPGNGGQFQLKSRGANGWYQQFTTG